MSPTRYEVTALQDLATRIGEHLRRGRRARFPDDSQADFARRVGVSRYTWQKAEKGDPSVAMGTYLHAARLLGIGDQVAAAFEPPPPSLFESRRKR